MATSRTPMRDERDNEAESSIPVADQMVAVARYIESRPDEPLSLADIGEVVGLSPSRYKKGGEGETIAYACRNTSLGLLMMAATDRGVCFAEFGDDETALQDQLQREFPKARLAPSDATDSPELDAWMAALNEHLSHNTPRPDVPLDIRGTAFQTRVWKLLLSVHEGEVVSYTELARRLGEPKAVRAVASACGRNRIAVLIPCHRVLRSDGSLGGYRWGLDRKQQLLEKERSAATE